MLSHANVVSLRLGKDEDEDEDDIIMKAGWKHFF